MSARWFEGPQKQSQPDRVNLTGGAFQRGRGIVFFFFFFSFASLKISHL